MALYTGTRATSGDGDAIVTPGAATKKVHIDGDFQIQMEATGPVTALLKVGSTVVCRAYLANAGDGLIRHISYTGAANEAVYINLSGNVSCGYVFEADIVAA